MRPATERLCRVCWSATFAKEEPAIDPSATRELTYGLFVLTSQDGGKDNGCICNTAAQVASDPLRLMVSVQAENLTREMIRRSGVFNVSVLTEDVPFETIRHFGMQSGRDVNKFESFPATKRSANGLLYITANTNAMFSCKVVSQQELGSHTLFIGEVTEAKVLAKAPSCTYAHYHKAIKPKF